MAVGGFFDIFSKGFKAEDQLTSLRFVKLGTDAGQVAMAGAGEMAIGVVNYGNPGETFAIGKSVPIMILGIARVQAHGQVNSGVRIKVAASGRADAASADHDAVVGISMSAATNQDDVIEVLLTPGQTLSTT